MPGSTAACTTPRVCRLSRTCVEGAVEAELKAKGVKFEDYDFGEIKTVDGVMALPDGSKAAWFKDSEGNILGLSQPPPGRSPAE